ncbi:alkaline phosphatase family protein [Devosia sp.]|uniref:alkaline phosphatase family protein n=1 Tax=Devosia sp. TaxID=1871048 RepID=UPI002F0BA9A9
MTTGAKRKPRRVVAVVLDGMRRDLVSPLDTPTLMALRQRGTWFNAHRSVFPSSTRVVSSSFATGCYPLRHGLAGNSVCLLDEGRLVLHDVGKPAFLDDKRRLTGTVLNKPTLAEFLAERGGAIIFNNVSPGAAYMHDPDGHGHVYHRERSYGPGRVPLEGDCELRVAKGIAGDCDAARRFIAEVVVDRQPAFALLWLSEPDCVQHMAPLGSPRHREILKQVDGIVADVLAAVDACREAGDDILFLVCSDHGHETVRANVDVAHELVGAGLKGARDSDDVVVAPNGTAALIYVADAARERLPAIAAFLSKASWCGACYSEDRLHEVGLPAGGGLAFAVSMSCDDGANEFGVPGSSYNAQPPTPANNWIGMGMHGGLGPHEQAPFMILEGTGFAAGAEIEASTSAVDVAPTILQFLECPVDEVDGRRLQQD